MSAEFGLPPTVRPTEGYITNLLTQLRESQLAVVAMREALGKAAPFFDKFKIKPGIGPQTVGTEAWVAHFVLSGYALSELQDGIGQALHNTSATAQQVHAEIERDVREAVWDKVKDMWGASPMQFRAAILGEKENN